MSKALKFLVAILIVAAMVFAIRKDKLTPALSYDGDHPDGKLLGIAPPMEGFGAFDVVSGGLIVAGLWVGAALLKHVPLVKKYVPATQAPT